MNKTKALELAMAPDEERHGKGTVIKETRVTYFTAVVQFADGTSIPYLKRNGAQYDWAKVGGR